MERTGRASSIILGAIAGAVVAVALRVPPPDLTDERARLTALEEEVGRTARTLAELEQQLAEERAAHALLRRRFEETIAAAGGTVGTPPPRIPLSRPENPATSPEALLENLFAEVVAGGALSASGTTGSRFVGLARTFSREGIAFLCDRLASPRDEDRLAAVRLAARFPSAFPIDPLLAPLVPPLTVVATTDGSELLRILAAEALARFPAGEATESWLAVLDAPGPAGARVHAWTALARSGHVAAIERFLPLLDRCDRTIPADTVVDTALAMADPFLLPAIRDAFDHPALGERHRLGILRTLARAGGEWLEFVRAVGMGPETAAEEGAIPAEGEVARASARASGSEGAIAPGTVSAAASDTGPPTGSTAVAAVEDPIGERVRALARELAPPHPPPPVNTPPEESDRSPGNSATGVTSENGSPEKN